MPFDKRAEKAELSDLFGVEGVCPDFLQTKRSQTLPSSLPRHHALLQEATAAVAWIGRVWNYVQVFRASPLSTRRA